MIHLVRHGESTWNVQRRTQGQTPHPPLTDLGRAQAAGAAHLLAEQAPGIAVVVTSDLVRARQSAAIVAERLGVELRVDVRLREQALGVLEGRPSAESLALVADLDWSDPDVPIGGGESARQVHDRLAAVLGSYAGTDAVLVSHGDAIRAALNGWAGHAPAQGPWVDVASSAVFALDSPGHWTRLSAAPAPPG